jgi:hypothetical protein
MKRLIPLFLVPVALGACKLEPIDPRTALQLPGFDARPANPAVSAGESPGLSPSGTHPGTTAPLPSPTPPGTTAANTSPATPPAAAPTLPAPPPTLLALAADTPAPATGTSTLLRARVGPAGAAVAVGWSATCGAIVPAPDTLSARFFAPRAPGRCRVAATLDGHAHALDLDITVPLEDLP